MLNTGGGGQSQYARTSTISRSCKVRSGNLFWPPRQFVWRSWAWKGGVFELSAGCLIWRGGPKSICSTPIRPVMSRGVRFSN
jgi:hypothetical protein